MVNDPFSVCRGRTGSAATKSEPQEQRQCRGKGADGVEQGIPGRSGTRSYEGLMNFIERGIACCDRQRGKRPGPAPVRTAVANSAKQQHTENEIFREMRRLADKKVNRLELTKSKRPHHPVQKRDTKARSILIINAHLPVTPHFSPLFTLP